MSQHRSENIDDRNASVAAPPKIGIVGGGLSGLATAFRLHRLLPEASISIFEAAPRVGGVIHSERCNDYLVDHGADMFATNPPAAMLLCKELGVADELIEPLIEGRGAKIVNGGRLEALPEGFVLMRATQLWPMIRTPLLSIRGKLRFLMERWIPVKRNQGEDTQDESIGDFVRRRMGHEMLDRIVAPLTAGIYTADIDRLSMLATMGPIAKMEATHGSLAKATSARRKSGEDSVERNSAGARYSQFRAFPEGMRQLIESLVAKLPPNCIHTETRVTSLTRSSTSGWNLNLTKHKAERCESFDEVVIATPPRVTADLIGNISTEAANTLADIEASSVAIVVLGVKQAQVARPANCFGFVVPLSEDRKILACSFASQKFSGRAPADRILIRVFVGGAMQPELLQKSDQELSELVREELAELIGLTGEPELTKVVRWNEAMPQYHVGHLDRVKKIESELAKVDGLTVVSNSLHGVGISPVISQADNTAKQIAARFQSLSNATG